MLRIVLLFAAASSLVGCRDVEVFVVRPRPGPLPELPVMSDVSVEPGDHRVTIHFGAVDGARDYRVYARPDPADVIVSGADPTELVAVRHATYRCAGTREAPPIARDSTLDPLYNGCEAAAVVDSRQPYTAHCGSDAFCFPTAGGSGNYYGEGGYAREPSEAALGYVFANDGPDRSAVRAFGDPDVAAYDACPAHVWRASRNKVYSADAAEWTSLRVAGWLDYGVAFYAPTTGATAPVYATALPSASPSAMRHFYFVDGPEHDLRAAASQPITHAFDVLTTAVLDAMPLQRILYTRGFANQQHDELAVGRAAFDALYGQGTTQPRLEVTYTWSGDPPAELILEALDAGCPFEGWTADHAMPSAPGLEAWTTLEAIHAIAPFDEAFVDGQFDGEPRPRPIARAFVTPTSADRPALDFLHRPGADTEPFVESTPTCDASNLQCDAASLHTLASSAFDVTFTGVEPGRHALFPQLGQTWAMMSDAGGAVLAQLRMSARTPATMTSTTFLYVTLDVSSVVSSARFPQILVDDRPDVPLWLLHRGAPGAGTGHTLIVEPFGDWPGEVRVEVCDAGVWPFPTACPSYDLRHLSASRYAPVDEVSERMGTDTQTRLEIYASTQRTYVFLDGLPYGCVDHETTAMPTGTVRVTFGDVLFHSGADTQWLGPLSGGFRARHAQTVSDRRFGELGFSSGVAAPPWDAGWPCVSVVH